MRLNFFKNITIVCTFIISLIITTNLHAQQLEQPISEETHAISFQKSGIAHYLYGENVEIDDPADTLKGWELHWIGGLHGSQASYSNWSNGGVNAVSATVSTLFDALYRKDKWRYHLEINLKYGRSRLADAGNRKTDDEISILNKVTRDFNNGHWHSFGLVNFRSQFDQGYNYDVPDGQGPELISSFFSPAYISEALGVGYDPTDYFTAGAGLKLKETIVRDGTLSTQYGLAPGDNFRLEPGFTIRLELEKNILENVKLVSSFKTFTNVSRAFKHTDFTFSNILIGTVNNFLNVTFEFDMVYDDDFSTQLQVKEVLAAGLSFKIM